MLKAVIFDMDGVIIDSETLHMEANQEMLKEFNLDVPLGYFSQFVGTTIVSTFEQIRRDYNLSVSLNEMLALDQIKCKEVYDKRGMIPVPGVISLIKYLHRQGLHLAIASSSTMEQIQKVTEAFAITEYFNVLISGSDLPHSKPNPAIFLNTLEALHVSAKECIVIEDSKNGCLAAKAAHIACIGYINPNSGNQDLYSACVAIEAMEALSLRYLRDVLLRSNGLPLTKGTTNRLILRELTVEDIKPLYAIYQMQNVTKYMDSMKDSLEIEIEKHRAYIENIYAFYGYGIWGIFLKDSDVLIGCCGLQNQAIDGNSEIELSYLLNPDYQKKGYALEACKNVLRYAEKELHIERIVAAIDKQNLSSIRLAKKLGMCPEREVFYHSRTCMLYSVNIKKQRYLSARSLAIKQYQRNPDTSVYSKQYKKI